jgi:hypothetical protein
MKYLSILLLAGILSPAFAGQSDAERQLSATLSEMVTALDAMVPMELDSDTRLDSAATFRNFMIYNNTLTGFSSTELDAFKVEGILELNVLENLCSNKDLKVFSDLGVVLVYRYYGNDGVFITEISKDMTSC